MRTQHGTRGCTVAATTAREPSSAVNTRRHIRGRRCWRALLLSPPAAAETWTRPNGRGDQVPCWRVPIRQRSCWLSDRLLSPGSFPLSAPTHLPHSSKYTLAFATSATQQIVSCHHAASPNFPQARHPFSSRIGSVGARPAVPSAHPRPGCGASSNNGSSQIPWSGIFPSNNSRGLHVQ